MSVDTLSFYYEGGILYDGARYVVTAKQRRASSKVEVVVEASKDSRERYGREFENVFDFFEWLKGK